MIRRGKAKRDIRVSITLDPDLVKALDDLEIYVRDTPMSRSEKIELMISAVTEDKDVLNIIFPLDEEEEEEKKEEEEEGED